MPHFTTFDNFASKAIVHPQFQEGSKAIVHPQFQEAAKAIVHPQFQPEAGRAIVHPQFQPEADGFMKLDDIKGEFASNVSVTYREDGANRFTTGGGGDSLTDAGLGNNSFHQGADVWTNGSATSIQHDALTKGGQKGVELVSDYWSPTPSCSIDETCTPTCALGFADDALVQQVNGTTGYEMEAGMGISDNRFVSEVLEALTSFGQSSDPALDAAGGFQPREVAAVEIGEPPEPKLWLQMLG